MKVLNIIAVSLLSKTTEAVEILPNLLSGKLHHVGKFAGRNPRFSLFEQFAQKTIIPRKPPDNRNGDRRRFVGHGKATFH